MSDNESDENSSSYDRGKPVASDEDTEDASETDRAIKHQDYTNMKEKIYQERLADLKGQLRQLRERVHPLYLERVRILEEQYLKSIQLTSVFQKIALERVEQEYELEKQAAHQEFEEKRIALKQKLIRGLEEKKKLIEIERNTMALTSNDFLLEMTELPIMKKLLDGDKNSLHVADLALIRKLVLEDLLDPKPIHTRTLRRKAAESAPPPEKKRKVSFDQINLMLDDKEIEEDLALIRGFPSSSKVDDADKTAQNEDDALFEVTVDDGKLHYNKKWFHRGQNVYYEGQDIKTKNAGVILSINSSEVCIKRRNTKVHITIPQLRSGAFILKKRSA